MKALEQCLNRLLEMDAETAARLEQLSGRCIAIEVSGTGISFLLAPETGALRLHATDSMKPDVTIRGRPLELLRHVAASGTGRGGGHIEIAGDVEVAQKLQQILSRLEPDWEEALSQWVGDTAARKLRRGAQALFRFGREARQSLAFSASEYLRYERQILIDRPVAESFMRSVDDLRDDAERLKARLARLDRHLGQS